MNDIRPKELGFRLLWDDVTAVEAKEIYDSVVDSHKSRVTESRAAFMALGVAESMLDYSPESLDIIWRAVVDHVHARGVDDAPLTTSNTRYWVAFVPTPAREIGLAAVHLVDHLAVYVTEYIFRRCPGSDWTIGKVKNQDGYRETLLAIAGGGHMAVERVLLVTLKGAMFGALGDVDPAASGELRRLLNVRGVDRDEPPAPETVIPLVEIKEIASGEYLLGVDSLEVDSDEIEALVASLNDADGVDRAIREARAVILVYASGLIEAEFQSLVDGIIRKAG